MYCVAGRTSQTAAAAEVVAAGSSADPAAQQSAERGVKLVSGGSVAELSSAAHQFYVNLTPVLSAAWQHLASAAAAVNEAQQHIVLTSQCR